MFNNHLAEAFMVLTAWHGALAVWAARLCGKCFRAWFGDSTNG
jgi:hypothetical protein